MHHTGGIRRPEGVYETLRNRTGPHTPDGLSVHYVVGVNGETYQFAPTNVVCLHAGMVNAWTVGIEVVSPGISGSAAHTTERKSGVVRNQYTDHLHGKRVEFLDFTQKQYDALTILCDELCDKLSIDRRVPVDETGALIRQQLSIKELAAFSGVMGHYHAHQSKVDPGTRFLEHLNRRWSK